MSEGVGGRQWRELVWFEAELGEGMRFLRTNRVFLSSPKKSMRIITLQTFLLLLPTPPSPFSSLKTSPFLNLSHRPNALLANACCSRQAQR